MALPAPARYGYVIREYSGWYQVSFKGDDGCRYAHAPESTSLWIERPSAAVTESADPLTDESPVSECSADAILGIININGSLYLNTVVRSEPVANVSFDQATAVDCRSSPIFSVKTVHMFPIDVPRDNGGMPIGRYDDPVLLGDDTVDWQKAQFDNSKNGNPASRDPGCVYPVIDINAGIIGDLNRLLTTGHYYSRAADLTHSLQRQWERDMLPLRPRRFPAEFSGRLASSPNGLYDGFPDADEQSKTLYELADPMFNWSQGMAHNIPPHWLTVLMQGYVGYCQQSWHGKRVEVLLIGRRSVYRAGTRLNARGIDSEGHVGNFVESETRLRVDGGPWKSFVQCRGSVPVFWGQRNIFTPAYFTRPINESEQAFLLHHKDLRDLYGDNVFIWILSLLDVKASEIFLVQALEHLMQTFSSMPIQLIKYNYNEKVKKSAVVPELLAFVNTKLMGKLRSMGYFDGSIMSVKDDVAVSKGVVEHTQRGVFRVNCLDCLDRTNAMQLMVAWVWLADMLDPHGLTNMYEYTEDGDNDFSGSLRQFRDMWCSHGDAISLIHAGTESIYSQHIREGRQSYGAFFHYTKTMVTRACSIVFSDEARQACLNLILNNAGGSKDSPRAVDTEITVPEPQPSQPASLGNLVIWCGTWNMNGAALSNQDNIHDWMASGAENGAEVFVFFLQEFVELSVLNVLSGRTEENKEMLFNGKILRALGELYRGRGVKFVHLKSCSMVGLYMTVFVSYRLAPSVKNIETTAVKTGFSGSVGNKGAVGMRFSIGGHQVTLVDVHINSGKLPTRVRIQELDGVMRNVFHEHAPRVLFDSDLFIFAGDFNFQVVVDDRYTTADIFRHIYGGGLDQLLRYDEFVSDVKNQLPFVSRLQEAPINFDPTYKFKKGTDFYDAKRTPAWCDRILYGGAGLPTRDQRVHCLLYRRHNLMISSDHKAVSALFVLEAQKAPEPEEDSPLIDL
ncbi:endonuclease/exonuclease/phosphatase family protein, putative [Babesia bigemina]|uniref:phosphoinositide 5-phosphatase n=1 Tax=Babesia bigemina TaxID=5866 RepID=A0A061D1K8_BABBI|nr:endonuclease/exonuclease/phosphatase family protein, putative [Babesia bigemina]CDR94681.1 endonuclease/exonuclease/phosphatase family protein, putative [Babesia bigemina]|eukprot:XP_012766867.1 endonuclease/exonuclease/phosphatase family protein, putative [Babesia bigemina]